MSESERICAVCGKTGTEIVVPVYGVSEYPKLLYFHKLDGEQVARVLYTFFQYLYAGKNPIASVLGIAPKILDEPTGYMVEIQSDGQTGGKGEKGFVVAIVADKTGSKRVLVATPNGVRDKLFVNVKTVKAP